MLGKDFPVFPAYQHAFPILKHNGKPQFSAFSTNKAENELICFSDKGKAYSNH
jgi:hypothetical protein